MAKTSAVKDRLEEILIGDTLNEEGTQLCEQFKKYFAHYEPWEVSQQSVLFTSDKYWSNYETASKEVKDWCEKHGLVEGVSYNFQ